GLPVPIYGTIWALVIAYFARFVGIGVRQSQAAFTQVSDELLDAARMSGASPLQAFRDVLLPLLRPFLMSLWTVLFIFIFMEISITIMLYTPNTMTLPVLLWSRMSSGHQTLAFAVAMLQATIVLVILYVSNRLFGTLQATVKSE
ncbi:MAG: iron(III) transport system permease protein, partial [Alphaproteobacteria bacterium]|nr:iron(III) transport system permease protein [Alphaproteobacteria bacterium]